MQVIIIACVEIQKFHILSCKVFLYKKRADKAIRLLIKRTDSDMIRAIESSYEQLGRLRDNVTISEIYL